jgi:hypothetical protein
VIKYFRYYNFGILNLKTKKVEVNTLETNINKKFKGKSKDIVRFNKIIYTFN